MNGAIKAELAAMQTAYDAIGALNTAGQRRAVMWLAAKLDVDLSDYDLPISREALTAAIEG